ncbi:helix-turn-helix domain-containing protein [Ectopseudomonas mendocina]|uniref:Helix-turn-helix domain-containing protein n=1 Tax=Ectopseudomonas mendocina TaxID=300 RepID=A0ABD7S0G9_ECTME|nr:LexA family transcriptional regulator [Pseudomonas mendocina]TRO14363.1 helix-turn-helix domain-containing protein [Pseudomonas mendocina]TRO19414.1 helix-turn-helix domain-containing protein [Pseudomonas mendocina]
MKKDPRRLPLSDWQIADSDRLKALYSRKRSELKLTQEKLAEALGEGVTQGAISHFMNRRTALSLRSVAIFAKALGVQVEEISPTLAQQMNEIGLHSALARTPNVSGFEVEAANTPLPAGGETSIDLDDRYAFIPQYDAKAAAGLGSENPHVEIRSTLAFKRDWLKVKGVKPANLIVIYAEGHSMWPTIDHGDVLLVDRSSIEPIDGQVFVLANGAGAIVKRLVLADGEWVIRSDNEDKTLYADRAFQSCDENEHRIIGRVVWRGGDL